MSDSQYNASDYTVGWVCALPLEMAAAKGMLDEIHPNLPEQSLGDLNSYVLGQVQGHNVVIACLPAGVYGTTSAATVAKDMLRTFTSIRFGLMVGIGGGAPSLPGHDIRLGDVVVSQPSGTTGGVIQYDRGKDHPDGFERTGSLNTPPQLVLTALSRLQTDHLMGDSRIPNFISELHDKYPKMKKTFSFQGETNDYLFQTEYNHPIGEPGCERCDRTKSRPRDARDDTDPVIHYGNIASGSQLIKDARTRDQLSKDLGVLCFEMEAAALMQDFPCVVIRGICDYADSHKNNIWQCYAAAVAAAFAKELLSVISPARVLQDKAIPQLVSDPVVHEMLAATNETISKHATRQETRYENDKQSECHQVFKTSRYEHFKNLNPDRVPGTCNWVLDHPQYKKWRQSAHDDLLWISADPGCGKSVLSKALIDEELSSADDHTVCYFFFKDNEDQNDLATALCAVLHQLFGRLPHLLRHAAHAFQQNGKNLKNEVDELWRILLAATTDESAGAVICLFDALDECKRDGRRKLIRLVSDFYTRRVSASGSMLKFLATSRPYRDIESGFNNIPPKLPSIRLAGEESNADISEEINLVIRQKVHELSTNPEVRDMLLAKLLATSNRTYLWLHLVWDELQQSRQSRTALMKRIDLLPSTVEDAYERILGRIRPDQREEAHIFLHIVVGARRPLTLVEMDVAFQLAKDWPDAIAHEELELDTDRLKSDIRQLCGLFIFISDSRIYLIHQTAKEFLVAREGDGDGPSDLWRRSLRSESSNEMMTRVCVQYLSFRDIRDDHVHEEQRKERSHFPDFPLLEYSAENWPAHFQDMGGKADGLFDLIFKLYDDQTERFKTWMSMYWHATYPHTSRRGLRSLHLAALIGHIEVVSRLIEIHPDNIDVPDNESRTALIWAAYQGHYQIVKLLLKNRADVNPQGGVYGDALQAASKSSYIEIMQLLLDQGADVNVQGGEYGNALHAASRHGYIEAIKLLLANGADVSVKDYFGQTPLSQAVDGSHSEAIKLLLANGANVNVKDDFDRTPLSRAVDYGYDEVIELLLTNGADVNVKDDLGRTPLSQAAENGHDKVIKLLLTKGAKVNVKDNSGRTPLSRAAENGHDNVIKLLLTKGAKVNVKNNSGRTPLSVAAQCGGYKVVELLCGIDHVDVNLQDNFGLPPLSWAAAYGRSAVVKLLLQTGRIEPSPVDARGQTPLSWATRQGSRDVVELLLGFDGFTASSVQATLLLAAARGHEAVVNMLINRGDVDLAAEDERGLTALQLADFNYHLGVEELLVAGDAPVASDFYGLQSLFGEDITC